MFRLENWKRETDQRHTNVVWLRLLRLLRLLRWRRPWWSLLLLLLLWLLLLSSVLAVLDQPFVYKRGVRKTKWSWRQYMETCSQTLSITLRGSHRLVLARECNRTRYRESPNDVMAMDDGWMMMMIWAIGKLVECFCVVTLASNLLCVLEDEVRITLLELEVGIDAFDHVLGAQSVQDDDLIYWIRVSEGGWWW